MGSSSTDTVAPSSLSEQKMEVKKRSEASETSHLKKNKAKKKNPKTSISLFFLIAPGVSITTAFYLRCFQRGVSIPRCAEQCLISSEGLTAPKLCFGVFFFPFFLFSLGHDLIFLSAFAERIV